MALNGIDIASYQAALDLHNINYDFVVVKATQGVGYVNPSCDKHVQQARSMGKLYGVYHYAGGGDATAEADYFVNNIKGYIGAALLALDFEANQNAAWNNNPNAWIKTFCDRVAATTGVKPLVYIQASALGKTTGIGDYGLWVAQYANMEATGYQSEPWNEGAYACVMRQYSSNGRLDGYNGVFDLNKFYGDATAWKKYANPTSAPVAVPALAPAPAPVPQETGTTYTVQSGDNLSSIAARFGTTYQHLAQVNGIANPNLIYAGQVLRIDGNVPQARTYTVRSGDNLSSIAARFGTSWQHLQQINGIANANLIYAGQVLRID